MRQRSPLLLIAALLAACSATTAPDIPSASARELSTSDLREINGIFKAWESAWNAHDMHAFAQLFHDDATWVVWTGRVWKGRKSIEDGHVEAHRTFFRHSTQYSHVEEVNPVAPGVVVARSRTTLTGDSREAGATIQGYKLLVLTRRDGVWRILYGQNTRLTPAVAALPK